MTLEELRAECRTRLDDIADPQLWTDADLTRYANEAEREACERAKLIEDDSTSAVCDIAGLANVATYTLHPSIIEVRSVTWKNRFLSGVSREALNDNGGDSFGRGYRRGYGYSWDWMLNSNWATLTGDPDAFIDPQEKYLTLVRIPPTAQAIHLSVYRYPLLPMADDADTPEIAPRHHIHLIEWMEKMAYNRRDADAGDPKLAEKKEAAFTAKFGVRPDANMRRQQRARRSNQVRMNPNW